MRLGALSLSPADGGSGRSFPGDVAASVADATLVCQDVGGLDPGLAPLYVKYAAPPAGAAVLQVWVIPVAAAWRVADPSDGLVVAGGGGGGGVASVASHAIAGAGELAGAERGGTHVDVEEHAERRRHSC